MLRVLLRLLVLESQAWNLPSWAIRQRQLPGHGALSHPLCKNPLMKRARLNAVTMMGAKNKVLTSASRFPSESEGEGKAAEKGRGHALWSCQVEIAQR